MIIVRSTDGRHLGVDVQGLNTGSLVDLDGFLFEVQKISNLENGNILLSNPNYQIECEEL